MLPTRTAAVSDAAGVREDVPEPEDAGAAGAATVRAAMTGTAAANVRQPLRRNQPPHSPHRGTTTTLRDAARATAAHATAGVIGAAAGVRRRFQGATDRIDADYPLLRS